MKVPQFIDAGNLRVSGSSIRAVHSSGMKDGAHKYIVTGVQKNSGPKAVRFQAEGVDRESKAHDHNEKTEKRAMNKNSG